MNSSSRYVLICSALALVTLAVYWPLKDFDFVNFDDPIYVTQNHSVLPGLTWQGISWAFSTTWTGNWHPLTWISHMADCQAYGLHPRGHHLTNLFFHLANTVILFGILRGMTGVVWRSAFVAGLFALHPMHVESVAWIAERKDVLSTFFGLLAIAAYARYVKGAMVESGPVQIDTENSNQKSKIKNQKSGLFYLLSVVFFAVGLMAKPMLVTLPFLLVLLDWWPLERFSISNLKFQISNGGSVVRLAAEKTPFFALTVASSIVTYLVQQKGGNVASLDLVPLSVRLANVPLAYFSYTAKLFWPQGLCALYALVPPPVENAVGAAICLLVTAAATVFWGRKRRYLMVGGLWFLGMLVPVIGVVQVGSQAMADRYTYLPSVGLFIAVGWGLGELAARLPAARTAVAVAASAALFGCIYLTHRLLPTWRDSVALFERVLAIRPDNLVGLCNMANALIAKGNYDESVSRLEQALALKPDLAPAEAALGLCRLQQSKMSEAAAHYRKAIEMDPRLPDALGNLAWILATSPETQDRDGALAIKLAEKACALTDNHNPLFLTYLAAAYAEVGRYDDAIAADIKSRDLALGAGDKTYVENTRQYLELHQAHRAFHFGPDPALVACKAAKELAEEGRTTEAIARYHEALRLDPTNVTALNNLAWILAADGDVHNRSGVKAVELAERACEITHYEQPTVIGTLAAAYAQAGQFAKAIEAGEKARTLFAESGNLDLAETNKALLELYREHKAYPESRRSNVQ